MSERKDGDFLSDILEAIRRAMNYTAGMTYDRFLADTRTQDAVIRNLEIIGEATKNLSSELRAAHPDVPWKSMAGARDRLIHDYFGVTWICMGNYHHRAAQRHFPFARYFSAKNSMNAKTASPDPLIAGNPKMHGRWASMSQSVNLCKMEHQS